MGGTYEYTPVMAEKANASLIRDQSINERAWLNSSTACKHFHWLHDDDGDCRFFTSYKGTWE